MSFWKWSRTAANNATADGSINWAEGPLVAENERHCFGPVINNENTNHDVWRPKAPLPSVATTV